MGCRSIREQKSLSGKRGAGNQKGTDETHHGKAVFTGNNKVYGMTRVTMSNYNIMEGKVIGGEKVNDLKDQVIEG